MKVGDYVKCDKSLNKTWYHKKLMRILEIRDAYEALVDYTWRSSSSWIYLSLLCQDKECINKKRTEKLNNILK